MFFKNYLNGLADVLDVKYISYKRDGINPADTGELCELFLKEFLLDCLDDHYKVYGGGNIVNCDGTRSSQTDIVLTNRNALKIFGDKGIYPVDAVARVFSVTSNLTYSKLKNCFQEIASIPKQNPSFAIEKNIPKDFAVKTLNVWKNALLFSCIFGYTGNIIEDWLENIYRKVKNVSDLSLLPSLIVVNKKAMIEKRIKKEAEDDHVVFYQYFDLSDSEMQGESF